MGVSSLGFAGDVTLGASDHDHGIEFDRCGSCSFGITVCRLGFWLSDDDDLPRRGWGVETVMGDLHSLGVGILNLA